LENDHFFSRLLGLEAQGFLENPFAIKPENLTSNGGEGREGDEF
jgi:hypothetical protein